MLCIPLGPQIQQEPVPGDLTLFSQVGVVHVVYGERGREKSQKEAEMECDKYRMRWRQSEETKCKGEWHKDSKI